MKEADIKIGVGILGSVILLVASILISVYYGTKDEKKKKNLSIASFVLIALGGFSAVAAGF
jgi:hypothetical protein